MYLERIMTTFHEIEEVDDNDPLLPFTQNREVSKEMLE